MIETLGKQLDGEARLIYDPERLHLRAGCPAELPQTGGLSGEYRPEMPVSDHAAKLIASQPTPPHPKTRRGPHAGQEPTPRRRQRPQRPCRALDAVHRQPGVQEEPAAARRRQGHALYHRRRPQDHRRRRRHVVLQCRPRPPARSPRRSARGRRAGLRAAVPVRHSAGVRTRQPDRRPRARRARPRVLLQFRIGGRRYRAENRAGLSPAQRPGRPHPADRPRARLSRRRLRRHLRRRHRR